MIRFSVLTSIVGKSAIGLIVTAAMCGGIQLAAQDKPAANAAPDVLVLSNGDTLHGKFVSSMGGKVTFHSDPLGDVTVGWDKIKELHSSQKFAVLDDKAKAMGRKASKELPVGTVEVENQTLTVHVDNAPVETPSGQERGDRDGRSRPSISRSTIRRASLRAGMAQPRPAQRWWQPHKTSTRFQGALDWCARCQR